MIALQKFDYRGILADPRSVLEVRPGPPMLRVIIGVQGRDRYLRECVRYTNEAIHESPFDVSVMIVEIDAAPRHRGLAAEFGCDYAFAPVDILGIDGKFSRGLAFDIGFVAAPETPWVMNLDCDLLMNSDFFQSMEGLMRPGVTHIQPYNDRRVRRATQAATDRIFAADRCVDLDSVTDYYLAGQGAAGGAIIVSSDAYARVGGYDEYFYDWAHEDAMFMVKLECLNGPVDQTPRPHKGYCTYSERTYLLHLEHEKLWSSNPKWEAMDSVYNAFCALPYEGKMSYIKQKAALFAAQINNTRK